VSIYSNTETSLAMSTLAMSVLHNFDCLAMSGLAFSVAPNKGVFLASQPVSQYRPPIARNATFGAENRASFSLRKCDFTTGA